jgi:hypothetical protein
MLVEVSQDLQMGGESPEIVPSNDALLQGVAATTVLAYNSRRARRGVERLRPPTP